METLLDLNSLSLEEATGHLRAVERRKKSSTSSKDSTGRLLLTARMKNREGSGFGAGSGGRGRRTGGKPPRGRGHDAGEKGGKKPASKAGPNDE